MKTLRRGTRLAGLLAGLVVLSPLAGQAQSFEGIIRIRLIDVDVDKAERLRGVQAAALLDYPTSQLLQLKDQRGQPAVSSALRTYLVRGTAMRLESDELDETEYTLISLDRGTIQLVRPDTETYVEISIPELTRPLFPMLQAGGYMVRPLNLSRTINGMTATAYEAVADDNIVRAWLTRDHASLTRLLETLARSIPMPNETAEQRLLGLAQLGAPIFVQLLDLNDGKLDDYQVQEIISLREQPVDPRLFDLPAGYRRVTE